MPVAVFYLPGPRALANYQGDQDAADDLIRGFLAREGKR